ncbi:ankyrin repeat domain-containing protein [Pseudoroseomonas wenyumeiae]
MPPAEATPPQWDEEILAYAAQVFQCARAGDAETMRNLLARGLPANLTNDKGDTLLMLASYHGHLETVRTLLHHGADPNRLNDRGQTRWPAPPSRAFPRSSRCCWRKARRSISAARMAVPP